MSINVSQLRDNLNKIQMENYEKAGNAVSSYFSNTEDMLMNSYTAKDDELKGIADKLGINTDGKSGDSLREAVQTVAKLKYEKASRSFSLFSKVMENAHQMLMNVINKIG